MQNPNVKIQPLFVCVPDSHRCLRSTAVVHLWCVVGMFAVVPAQTEGDWANQHVLRLINSVALLMDEFGSLTQLTHLFNYILKI